MSERGTETQCLREKPIDRLRSDRVVTLLLSLLGWRGEWEGEKDVSRVCVVGTEAQLASVCMCVCVCVFERGVDRLLSRSRCHPTPSVSGSVCVCV